MFNSIFCVASLLYGVAAYTDEATRDKIQSLPGAEDLDITFNQFSGYLDIPESKHMHYWYDMMAIKHIHLSQLICRFVESMNNPTEDPIAFWTNGNGNCPARTTNNFALHRWAGV
jgi:hypothetical protein